MFDSQWLNIAIGVVFVWFLLALSVTAVNEALSRLFSMRSRQLWQALHQMLDGQDNPTNLFRNVLQLFRYKRRPDTPTPPATASFTHKLYGTEAVQSLETRSASNKKTKIDLIPSKIFRQALFELTSPTLGTTVADDVKAFLAREDIPASVRKHLTAIWNSVNHDVTAFAKGIEDWFDAQMTRLSAIYKNQLRWILAFIGIAIALAGYAAGMRTDSLNLVSRLQHDAALRQVVVNTASSTVRDDLAKAGCPTAEDSKDHTSTECQIIGASKLKDIDLIIKSDSSNYSSWTARLGYELSHWRALLGVLITGLAISFGSTFWFDILRKLVGIRDATKTGS